MDSKIKKYVLDTLAKGAKDITDKYANPENSNVQKHPDRAGNKDDVFKATNVKEFDRAGNRFGNDQGSSEDKWKDFNDGSETKIGQYEEFDALNETEHMTPQEKMERENIVTGMKDRIADFKKRYGKDWKKVMYKTATDMVTAGVDMVGTLLEEYNARDIKKDAYKTLHVGAHVEIENMKKLLDAHKEKFMKDDLTPSWEDISEMKHMHDSIRELHHGHARDIGALVTPLPTVSVTAGNSYSGFPEEQIWELADKIYITESHWRWDKLVKKLKSEGKSTESADKIAGAIKHAKYGNVQKPHSEDVNESKDGHWMEKAFKHAHGQLHKKAGVPQGQKIPLGKEEALAHSGSSKTRHQAQAALNARHANEEISIMDAIILAHLNEDDSLTINEIELNKDAISIIVEFYNILTEENKNKFDVLIQEDIEGAIETINSINEEN